MTSTCLFQSGQRSRKSFGACKTCTHVSYQQISILTLNFNTSFVGHLTNVATLEHFTLTVFFFVFVERCSRVCLGCIERYTWLAVLTRKHVFLCHGMFFFWIPRKLFVSLVLLLSGRQRWESFEHVALSISVFLSRFSLLVSVSVLGTIQRSVDTHQSRSVVKFYVAQSQRCCVSFSFVSSQGRFFFCVLVVCCRHVSLIVDQLDSQRCRSPCGTVVEWSWDHW